MTNRADLTVANDLQTLRAGRHTIHLVRPGADPETLEPGADLAERLVARISTWAVAGAPARSLQLLQIPAPNDRTRDPPSRSADNPAAPETGERVYFPELDGLRFIAFMMVYLFHQGVRYLLSAETCSRLRWLRSSP